MVEKSENENEKNSEEFFSSDPSSASPQPAAEPWSQVVLEAGAVVCELGAEILHANGRDGLAIATKTTAYLLHLVAVCVGSRGDDRK